MNSVLLVVANMTRYLLIFIASGLGGAGRYWLGGRIQELSQSFPWATLTINVSGCLAIGFFASLFAGPWPIREDYRLAVLVGFSRRLHHLLDLRPRSDRALPNRPMEAPGYVVATNVAGLLAVLLGSLLGNKLFPSTPA